MYNNIVFDLGGVVVDYNPKDFLMERFFHEKTERSLYAATFGSEDWPKLDSGELLWPDAKKLFIKRGREMDMEMEMQVVVDEWTEMLTTRRATVTLMRLLKKKGFNLYYLSNICGYALDDVASRNFWSVFEGGVASYEVGINKPDLEIYRILLRKYNLIPQETIFTDDTKENASSAFQAGITGIHFDDVKGFCKMLVTYGINV